MRAGLGEGLGRSSGSGLGVAFWATRMGAAVPPDDPQPTRATVTSAPTNEHSRMGTLAFMRYGVSGAGWAALLGVVARAGAATAAGPLCDSTADST